MSVISVRVIVNVTEAGAGASNQGSWKEIVAGVQSQEGAWQEQ